VRRSTGAERAAEKEDVDEQKETEKIKEESTMEK
jgi:hypothetical protein